MNDERARHVAVRVMQQVHEGMLASFIDRGGRGVDEAELIDGLAAAIEQLRAPRVLRAIRISNVYEGGAEIPVTVAIELRQRGPDEDDAAWDEYLRDILWPLTGTGRTEGNAGYFAESIDGLDPEIRMEWC